MTPRRTMSIAQQLYEGVEISGQGSVGLITYMRTDSLRLSDEALTAARTYITARYGAQYCPPQPRHLRPRPARRTRMRPSAPRTSTSRRSFFAGSFTGAVQALQAHLGPLHGLPDGKRRYDNVSVDTVSAGYTFRANYSE